MSGLMSYLVEPIKFGYRLITRLIIFLVICVPVMLLGMIVLLPYLPFSNSKQLPYLLRWFDCADFYVGRDTGTYEGVVALGWWARYTWLAFRNPMNYFDYQYLGLHISTPIEYIRYNPEEDLIDNKNKEGLRYVEIVNGDGKTYYEYFYIKKLSATKCFRFRMGWKIKDKDQYDGKVIQWCFVISPYYSYTGV